MPDVRHINDLGSPPSFDALTWSENQNTPVGVWHSVPTNNFLNLESDAVSQLRERAISRYLNALQLLEIEKRR